MAKCSICDKPIVTGYCVCDGCYSKFFVADKLKEQPLPEQPQTNGDKIRSMTDEELLRALHRLKTDKHACLGCGHEHNCSIHGCAIINAAIAKIKVKQEECCTTTINEKD